MEQITIRFAQEQDISAIMQFLDQNWKKDHILARDEAFFAFQHVYGAEVSYVIAVDEQEHILGTLGYIPYGQEDRDVMTVMWKVVHTSDSMLGIKLLQFLIEKGGVRSASSPGINKKTVGIYQFLGYHVGVMKHWYRLRKQEKYIIAQVTDDVILQSIVNEQISLFEIQDVQQLQKCFDWETYQKDCYYPYKEKAYIERRYFEHPIYQYHVYGVGDAMQKTDLLLVFRIQEHEGARALRLVDCIGNVAKLQHVTNAIDGLLEEYEAEYTDLYENGLCEENMQKAGWMKVEDTQNVIPEYFNPYTCQNVDIRYFSTREDIVLFKADGDQDRPN